MSEEPDWKAAADAMVVALIPRLEAGLKKAAETIYDEVLYTAEEHLKDNVQYNIQSAIDSATRQALHDRQALRMCERHREDLFWALKSLIATARAVDAEGDLGARLMAAVDKAATSLDAKFMEPAQ